MGYPSSQILFAVDLRVILPLVIGILSPIREFHGLLFSINQDVPSKGQCKVNLNTRTLSNQDATTQLVASPSLGGGFKYFLCASLFGEDSHFD